MSKAVSEEYLMTEGPIAGKILRYALPVFIGHLFQQLYNTADALIVGNLVGSRALAAVTGVGTIVFMAIGFFLGFSMGSGIVIARYIGAQDNENIHRSVHTSVAVGLFFSVLLTVAGVLLSPAVLHLMGTPADVFDDANTYLQIYFAGCTGFVMYNTFVGILQASGDSKHPLYYLIISSMTNVVLDIFFIVAFGMGVDGAALATVISQALAALLVLRRLRRQDDAIRVSLTKIRFYAANLKEIVRYGFPAAIQNCVTDFANMMIQSYVNSFTSAAMAGMGAYSKVEGFAFLPVNSFSIAMSTFISQNRGAGEKERMRQGARFGLLCSVFFVEIIGVLTFVLSPLLVSAFNRDPEVVAYGVLRGHICSLFLCLMGFTHVCAAVLRGLGKPMAPMLIILICWCAVRVAVLSTIGQSLHDIRLICWLYPITWTLSSIAEFTYLQIMKRRGDL